MVARVVDLDGADDAAAAGGGCAGLVLDVAVVARVDVGARGGAGPAQHLRSLGQVVEADRQVDQVVPRRQDRGGGEGGVHVTGGDGDVLVDRVLNVRGRQGGAGGHRSRPGAGAGHADPAERGRGGRGQRGPRDQGRFEAELAELHLVLRWGCLSRLRRDGY